ncbi:Tfp pilus assembly protein PilO [Bradyrhizobium sp. GM7.3]
MSANSLQELDEMAVKLDATLRKLPDESGRDDLLQDIAKFRAELLARLPSETLKTKGDKP